jgi:hypothetical protein
VPFIIDGEDVNGSKKSKLKIKNKIKKREVGGFEKRCNLRATLSSLEATSTEIRFTNA